MDRALCAYYSDPDAFFPGAGQSSRSAKAKKICARCPVSSECFDYKVRTHTTDGIWGGQSNKRK